MSLDCRDYTPFSRGEASVVDRLDRSYPDRIAFEELRRLNQFEGGI